MSEEEKESPQPTQLLKAEYRDEELQLVEVMPYKDDSVTPGCSANVHITPELQVQDQEPQYHVVTADENGDKKVMPLGLLNFTLVGCEVGGTYRLVSGPDAGGADDATVTCVLQPSDTEETSEQEVQDDSYVLVEGEQGPYVYLQSSLKQINPEEPMTLEEEVQPPKISPAQILEKAKAIQKMKNISILSSRGGVGGGSGRGPRPRPGRRARFPDPHELLQSPNFKLFLYSCKMCQFKCNAIKELTQHKSSVHSGRGRGGGARASHGCGVLQCARCPHRAHTHSQLMKHIQENHPNTDEETEHETVSEEYLDSEAGAADVLVCGACGFESDSRAVFRKHIREHRDAA